MRRLLCWVGVHDRARMHFEEVGHVHMDCAACGRILSAAQYEMGDDRRREMADEVTSREAWGRPQ